MAIVVSILGVVFVFSLITFVHEFGHYIMARRNGVRVDEFAFGIPPRVWSVKKGETRYSLNLLPIGGYVRLYGEEGSDEKGPRTYKDKPAYIRVLILMAGVFLNIVLAWFILFGSYLFGMKPIIPGMANHQGVVNNIKAEVVEVKADTPAQKSGIAAGDIVKKVDGTDVHSYEEMTMVIQTEAEKNKDKPLIVLVERNGKVIEKKVTVYTEKEKIGNREVEQTYIGVVLKNEGKVSAPPIAAARAAFEEVGRITLLTLEAVVELFRKIIFQFQMPDNVAGPVGIFVVTGSFAQLGFSALIQFAAVFSIAVAVFNLIPIPALDGGQVMVIVIESVVRKKLSMKVRNAIQLASFGMLILLMVVVTFKDVFTFGIIK